FNRLAAVAGGVFQRTQRRTASEGEPLRGVFYALCRQPVGRGLGRRQWHRHRYAATADRRQQARRTVRHQQENGPGRRLLEVFQQRVGSGGIHVFGRVHDGNAPPTAV